MPDALGHELTALRDRVAMLAQGPLAALRDDATLAPADLAVRVRALSKQAGLFSLTQADDTPALVLLVVRETLARHAVGHLPGLFGADAGVLAGVAEPLRSSHLLPLLAGDKRSGFAFTEPSDAPRPSWATVDGDHLVITGQKSYVTGGADADFLVALVEVEGQGPAMVVIDTAAPGDLCLLQVDVAHVDRTVPLPLRLLATGEQGEDAARDALAAPGAAGAPAHRGVIALVADKHVVPHRGNDDVEVFVPVALERYPRPPQRTAVERQAPPDPLRHLIGRDQTVHGSPCKRIGARRRARRVYCCVASQCGNTAPSASAMPFRPKVKAIRMSTTPQVSGR